MPPARDVGAPVTDVTGVGGLHSGTGARDHTVSQTFVRRTPYVGAGLPRVQAKALATALAQEKFNRSRAFGGINVNLAAVNLAFEAEKMGGNTSLSAKVGIRF